MLTRTRAHARTHRFDLRGTPLPADAPVVFVLPGVVGQGTNVSPSLAIADEISCERSASKRVFAVCGHRVLNVCRQSLLAPCAMWHYPPRRPRMLCALL